MSASPAEYDLHYFRAATVKAESATVGPYWAYRSRAHSFGVVVTALIIGRLGWYISPAFATAIACCFAIYNGVRTVESHSAGRHLTHVQLTALSPQEALTAYGVWLRLALVRGSTALDSATLTLGATVSPLLDTVMGLTKPPGEPALQFALNLCIFANLGIFKIWHARRPLCGLLPRLKQQAALHDRL